MKTERIQLKSFFFVQLPYSHLMATDRQDSVTAALAAAAVVASSAMERTRLEEEKLRVQSKDKKDQSENKKKNRVSLDFCFIILFFSQ